MTNQRNRDKLQKYQIAINLIVKLMRLLPYRFSLVLYDFIISWHGYIARGLRYCILRAWCKHCGYNVRIDSGVELVHIKNISLGNNVSIHSNCYFDAGGNITIGNDVAIAHQTSILPFNHSDRLVFHVHLPFYRG